MRPHVLPLFVSCTYYSISCRRIQEIFEKCRGGHCSPAFLCLWVPAGGHRPALHNETDPVEVPLGRFYILSGERKPPFERRCPSSQTGAEDCISPQAKCAKQTRFCKLGFTLYVLLRKTQSSVSLRLTAPFKRGLRLPATSSISAAAHPSVRSRPPAPRRSGSRRTA